MKIRKKHVIASLAVSSTLSLLVASVANPGRAQAASVNGETLTIGQGFPFTDTFIPYVAGDGYTAQIWMSAFDPLLLADNHLNFQPWLAKSWSWSSDHKTLTMTLQPKANWTDGKPVTSDDVLYTLDFLASPDYTKVLQGSFAYLTQSIKGFSEIHSGKATSFAQTGGFTKVNDKTFQLHLTKVDAALLWSSISAIVPLPSHIMKQEPIKDMENWSFNKLPKVSDGPYIFTQVNGTDSVEMVANPHYWAGAPHISNVVFRTVNAEVAPGLLANGSLDMQLSGLKYTDVANLKKSTNIKVVTSPSNMYYYLDEKLYLPEFKDVRVRQAFEYAMDRQAMIKGILKGYGAVLNSPILPGSWAAATEKDGLNPYNYNPKKANHLLDEAGWKLGSDGWRIDPFTHKTADLHLLYPIDPIRQSIAMAVKQYFAGIHVKVTLDAPLDLPSFYKKVESDDKSVQMFIGAWGTAVDPDPVGIWQTSDEFNLPRWSDSYNMKLISQSDSAAAYQRNYRKSVLVKWQVYVNQQMPSNFLFMGDNVVAYNRKLNIPAKDWNFIGPFNMQDWSLSN
ncbi:MAG: hypothetical protein K6T83_13170 [Alicyclobacillus sp.]|nr:hypothetical protein [Alicyclobacillus sp.]